MKIATYIIRFLLALLFIYAGIEKLFLPYEPSLFKANASMTDPKFFEFYDLLQKTGFLYFVGFFQMLCGILMIFKRTYLLASVMLVPLILCLLMTHIFISRYGGFIIFDGVLFGLNAFVFLQHFKKLKATFLRL
jgi:uncharacterized membrane protein YphA (DoxX/SURF4 family)